MVGNEIEVWIPRSEGALDEIPPYTHHDYFTVKMYHGGLIKGNTYVGEKISYYDNVDKDMISLIEVDSMVTRVDPAYAGRMMDYWYYIGNNLDALTKLSSDMDTMTMAMCACVHEIRLVVIYIDHLDLHGDYQSDLYDVEIMEQSSACGYSQVGSSVVIEELLDSPRIMKKSSTNRKQDKEVGVKIREVKEEVPTHANESSEYDNSFDGDYQPANGDEDYAHYGEDEDWTTEDEVHNDAHLKKRDKIVSAAVGTSGVNAAENVMVEDNEAMFGAIDFDEEDIESCYKREGNAKSWEVAFYKSDRKRVNAICKADGCPFELTSSKMQHEDSLMIRKYQPQHMCAHVNENSMAKGTKKPPLTKDDKRAKLKKRAEKLKEKRDQEKVATKTVAKATTKASTASTTTQVASTKNKGAASTKSSAPTRSLKRIIGGDKQDGK
ncbi:hypothetical protein ACLB2K_042023 [Fragaria x ananassa]